jgi:hypothetical protein
MRNSLSGAPVYLCVGGNKNKAVIQEQSSKTFSTILDDKIEKGINRC